MKFTNKTIYNVELMSTKFAIHFSVEYIGYHLMWIITSLYVIEIMAKQYRQGYILANLINLSVKLFSTVSIVFFPVDFKSARYHSRFFTFN